MLLRPHQRRNVDATDFTQIRQKKAPLKYDQPNPTQRSSWADPCTRLDTQQASRDVNTRHVTSTSVERRRKSTLTSRAPPTPTTCRVRARVGVGLPSLTKTEQFSTKFPNIQAPPQHDCPGHQQRSVRIRRRHRCHHQEQPQATVRTDGVNSTSIVRKQSLLAQTLKFRRVRTTSRTAACSSDLTGGKQVGQGHCGRAEGHSLHPRGTMEKWRLVGQRRQRIQWLDNVKEWVGASLPNLVTLAGNRRQYSAFVHRILSIYTKGLTHR